MRCQPSLAPAYRANAREPQIAENGVDVGTAMAEVVTSAFASWWGERDAVNGLGSFDPPHERQRVVRHYREPGSVRQVGGG
ncbi:MAG: hypothetical protein H0U60_13180 [Blastocatellia bacterium]|nr:hypothetical protein [Blastocatellia bacterium]